jgi:spermidine synthase
VGARERSTSRLQELAHTVTPMGAISLRRRRDPATGDDVYEVKLDDDFLMSSTFTVAEVALAELGLAAVAGDELDVVVGGLGLGCTAAAALADGRVRSLSVVEALEPVIDWHRRGLLPLSSALTGDERCAFVHEDFFAVVAQERATALPERCHALLVDIDHSPRHVLHPSHAGFYTRDGLAKVAALLHPGGVFALWSDDPPDVEFLAVLQEVFDGCRAEVVDFANPLTGGSSANTVYLATARGADPGSIAPATVPMPPA